MKRLTLILATVTMLAGCAIPAETASPPGAGPQAQPGEQTTGTPKPKHWVTVAKLSGTSDKRGPDFHLGGGDARLAYRMRDTSGYGIVSLSVYVVAKGKSLEKSGGFPEISADKTGRDSTRLVKDPGDYYLDVKAANGTWSVTVQEKRS